MLRFLSCTFVLSIAIRASGALLTNGFAHNDYLHSRPVLDALAEGFCGVEADIHLVDGKLLVGHDAASLTPERTLTALYLEPLRKRVRANQGKVYPNGPELLLLIDIKTEAESTYRALRPVLSDYAEMLTRFGSNSIQSNAISVILSGNRPIEMVSNEVSRLVAIDGRLADLDGNASLSLIPLISDSWSKSFRWKGSGAMPAEEKMQLEGLIRRTHQQKRKLRLWAAPDTEESWRLQGQMGIDWINTDKLSELARSVKK